MITLDTEEQAKETQKKMCRRMLERSSGASTKDFCNQPKLRAEYRARITEIRRDLESEGKGGIVIATRISRNNWHYQIKYPSGQLGIF